MEYEIEIHLYRIIQEIFSNIIKHSGASTVDLRLFTDENFVNLHISDNGKGMSLKKISKDSKGFGLENINRRVYDMNGRIEIKSVINRGTLIKIQVPLSIGKVT